MSGAAREVAEVLGRVTIWDLWPCGLYNPDPDPSNPMRCIHHDDIHRQLFYGNMSLAFAQKACTSADVLHSYEDYLHPPKNGIWATIEYPELVKKQGLVNWLRKLQLHPEFPLGSGSDAVRAWLASPNGTEWLRCLRIQEEVKTKWSMIFWRRIRTATHRLKDWIFGELRKRGQTAPSLEKDPRDRTDTTCPMRDKVRFFDETVDW